MLIKNGKVVIFENDDVKVKDLDIRIKGKLIHEMAENLEPEANEKVLDATDKVVMPGLINTHAHIAMSIFRGTFEGCDLYTWLNEKIWPIEAKLTEEDVYNASMLSIVEMISTGTTCVNDHYFFSKKIREALEKSKMRAVITRVLMDSDGEEASENRISEFIDFIETRDERKCLITYTVHLMDYIHAHLENYLKKSRDLASKYNLPVHVHFLESLDEIEDIKNMHGHDSNTGIEEIF